MADSKRVFGNNYCGDSQWLMPQDNCINILNEKAFLDGFKADCIGRTECYFDLNAAGFTDTAKDSRSDCKSGKA